MAYSDNIKAIAVGLCSQSHSAEEVSKLLSDASLGDYREGYAAMTRLGSSFSISFTEVDWKELRKAVPDAKTIRKWTSSRRSPAEDPKAEQVTPEAVGARFDSPATNGCMANPDDVDVLALATWGVPKNEAAGILFEWRECHRESHHDRCQCFPRLKEDVQLRKIPFRTAKAMLELGLRAIEFEDKELVDVLEGARRYRPWESRQNWEAAMKEWEKIHELDPATSEKQRQHLGEITQLLLRFQDEVESALPQPPFQIVFQVENEPLFRRIMDHCPAIGRHFHEFDVLRFCVELDEENIVASLADDVPPGATPNFVTLAVAQAVDLSASQKRPEYEIDAQKGQLFLSASPELPIASGPTEVLHQCETAHMQLVRRIKDSADSEAPVNPRKKIPGALRKIRNAIDEALKTRDYASGTWCPDCPKLRPKQTLMGIPPNLCC